MILSVYLPLTIFFIIGFKQFNLWMYLWQLKEYRGDKMMDYLNLPESIKVVWDKWTILRLGLLTYYLLFIYLASFFTDEVNSVAVSIFYLLCLFQILEVLEFLAKIVLKKGFRVPSSSRKVQLHMLLSGGTIFLILPLLIVTDLALVNIVSLITLVLFIPIIIGYWLLVMFPIDYYVKFNFFKKARAHRESLDDLQVVAVSGAYGKTSSKSYLNQLLGSKYKVVYNHKNQNSNVSCARWTMKLTPKTDFFVCELGAYKRGDGAEIAKFIRPTASIITGLNHQHYSLFGSEENIVKTESESIDFLSPGDPVFINWSSPMCHKVFVPDELKLIKYGLAPNKTRAKEYDIYATEVSFDKGYTLFDLYIEGKKRRLKTNLLGKGNIENIVGSIAVSRYYKLPWKDVENTLLNLTPAPGTLAKTDKKWGTLIDDSYNANLDGVKNALSVLADYKLAKKSNYTVAFVDDILELGDLAPQAHTDIAEAILKSGIDEVFLTGRNFARYIADYLIDEGFDKTKIHPASDRFFGFVAKDLQKLKRKKSLVLLLEGKQSGKYLKHL
jgi:UDP-N-acetylmuramoyl-tripeptide--D-alanyl-D-alanine ligase